MRLEIPKRRVAGFLSIACATWLLFLFIAFHNTVRADEKILIAAASDLKFAMDDICHIFEQANPDIHVDVSYGSSGNFYAQIKQGAPFDLFFSADATYPTRLEEEGLAVKGQRYLYAIGKIVLWIPKRSALNPQKGLNIVLKPEVKKTDHCKPKARTVWSRSQGGASILSIMGYGSEQTGLWRKHFTNGTVCSNGSG